MLDKKKEIILFGASTGGKIFLNYIETTGEFKILAFADNDESKQGGTFYGYDVIHPDSIANYSYDEVIITSNYFPEIREQLVGELNIPPDKIKIPPKSTTGNKKTYRPFEDEKTLALAEEVLKYIVNVFNENKIIYYIDHGSLLGIVRDGGLIPWDDDIDINTHVDNMDEILTVMKARIKDLPKNDLVSWKMSSFYSEDERLLKLLIYYDENNKGGYRPFPLSIESFEYREGKAVQALFYFEEKYFIGNDWIDYKGYKISTPKNHKEYLSARYGDWTLIKKDMSHSDFDNYKMPTRVYEKDIYK